MKILLVGCFGQVGWELQRTLACLGSVTAVDRSTQPLAVDLEDPDAIRRVVDTVKPQLIVNAAAYTAVDRAEREPEPAHRINALAPGLLAEAAAETGAGLVHYSTDYVFAGDAVEPYHEESEVAPQSTYGETKWQGEAAIRRVDVPHLILRTSWVYGARGGNFLLTMLRLMRERERLTIVDDQVGAPTWSRQIAECTALMIAQCRAGDRFDPGRRSGTYHLTCGGVTSWFGFAAVIREMARGHQLLGADPATLRPIASADYPTAARRPPYSVLSNEKLQRTFALALPDWEAALARCLADLAEYRTER